MVNVLVYLLAVLVLCGIWILIANAMALIWNTVFVPLYPHLPSITWWQMWAILMFINLFRLGSNIIKGKNMGINVGKDE